MSGEAIALAEIAHLPIKNFQPETRSLPITLLTNPTKGKIIMSQFRTALVKKKSAKYTTLREVFVSESGAIDLASIMVGIIVIGLIGGVIAATVFGVIPWAQDNAARASLNSLAQSQNAFAGLHASTSPTASIVAASDETVQFANGMKFTTVENLIADGLIQDNDVLATTVGYDESCYVAKVQSASGNVFYNTSQDTKPRLQTSDNPPDVSWCGAYPLFADEQAAVEPPAGGGGDSRTEFVAVILTATTNPASEFGRHVEIACFDTDEVNFRCNATEQVAEAYVYPEEEAAVTAMKAEAESINGFIYGAMDACAFGDSDCVTDSVNKSLAKKFPIAGAGYSVDFNNVMYQTF